jgi:hypothetical protein
MRIPPSMALCCVSGAAVRMVVWLRAGRGRFGDECARPGRLQEPECVWNIVYRRQERWPVLLG